MYETGRVCKFRFANDNQPVTSSHYLLFWRHGSGSSYQPIRSQKSPDPTWVYIHSGDQSDFSCYFRGVNLFKNIISFFIFIFTLDHGILIMKLKHYGIRNKLLDLIINYLSNRIQYVEYNNISSDDLLIKCGVPRGSILWPLFFYYIEWYCQSIKKFSTITICRWYNPFHKFKFWYW